MMANENCAGAKAHVDIRGFVARLKSCPFAHLLLKGVFELVLGSYLKREEGRRMHAYRSGPTGRGGDIGAQSQGVPFALLGSGLGYSRALPTGDRLRNVTGIR
jgi:hypothetical protein